MASANIGPGNCLLSDGTKPSHEPMLTNHKWLLLAFMWGKFRINVQNNYLLFEFIKNYFTITNAYVGGRFATISRVWVLLCVIQITHMLQDVRCISYARLSKIYSIMMLVTLLTSGNKTPWIRSRDVSELCHQLIPLLEDEVIVWTPMTPSVTA